ncbi:MAG TPA: CheB methylesterase domain-containing protein, partial [Pirellulales bacterium]|nr:CheB methylesterase domain-containing protein [Pirellulales bacterium]
DLLVIGCSTGGPNALAALIPELPADLPVPVLIVQHMPPVFTRSLSERLDAQSKIAVKEGAPGDVVEVGHAYLAPGDYHLEVERQSLRPVLRTHQGPPENSCRPAVDVLFRSAVQAYGAGVLGVVLTGMGQDGLRGCELIREAGGQVVVQDEATSIVWGMPGFVARAGLADRILPLEQIAGEIVRRVTAERRAPALVQIQ